MNFYTRTKEALAKLKAEGKILGRSKDSKFMNPILKENHNQAVDFLKKRLSKSAIAKIYRVHRNMVAKYVKEEIEENSG